MKKVILLSIFVLASIAIFAQHKSEIPTAVISKFETLHPGVNVEKWEKEGKYFEADYHIGKVECSDTFDAAGNLIETEKEIQVAELPASITEYLAKNHSGDKIDEACKITKANGNVFYEVELGSHEFLFDAQGNLVSSEMQKDEDDEDKD